MTPVETNIDEPSTVPASAEVAKVFDVDEGAQVVRRYRRQGTTTAHYRLAENFYPVELAGGEILEQMQRDVLLVWIWLNRILAISDAVIAEDRNASPIQPGDHAY